MTREEIFWVGAVVIVVWWLWHPRSHPRGQTSRNKISRETFQRGEPAVPDFGERLSRQRIKNRGRPRGAYPYWWSDMLRAYDYTCVFCGFRSYPKATGEARLHQEHDVPLARGGRHHVDNIRPACGRCNLVKGIFTGAEFESFQTHKQIDDRFRSGRAIDHRP